MRLTSHRGAIAALALLCSAFNPQARADESEIAVVVKIGGIPWFTAMEQGIKKAGEENHVKAYMVGPTTADPAQQVRAVEESQCQESHAGAAIVTVAKMVLDKTPIVDGMDIPGLGKASVDPEKRIIRVIKVLAIDKSTVDQLAALGL